MITLGICLIIVGIGLCFYGGYVSWLARDDSDVGENQPSAPARAPETLEEMKARLEDRLVPVPETLLRSEKCDCRHPVSDHILSCFGGGNCDCRRESTGALRYVRDKRSYETELLKTQINRIEQQNKQLTPQDKPLT